MDQFGRRRPGEGRLVSRSEALTQAVTERAVELVLSAVDVNALLDEVDLNAVLDRIDLNSLLERVDLNAIVENIDLDALVEKTDLGAIIASSSSGIASEALERGPQPCRRARRIHRPLDWAAAPPPIHRPARAARAARPAGAPGGLPAKAGS